MLHIVRCLTVFAALSALSLAASCSSQPAQLPKGGHVICSTLPLYCFASAIAGDVMEVQLLPKPSIGPHSYQLTLADRKRLSGARAFIVNGLGLELGIPDAFLDELKVSGTPVIVAASELNADFLRPSFCGACAAHDAGLEDEGEHHHAHSHGEHDPHVWLCREGAIGLARGICSGLVKLAPDKESKLRANLGALEARINALYDTMHAALDPLRGRKLLTFHEAWAYFADEFNFIIAATMTLSGRNVSLKARQRIDELIRSGDVQTIFVEPQFDATIARELAKETGVSLATLDPAEVTMDKLSPDCYFAAMERNLAELRKAFGLVKNEQPVGEIPAHGRDSRVVDKGRDSAFLRYEDSSCLCRRA